MYEMIYQGKKKTFKNIEQLSNELLWIWVEDLGLDYTFNPEGTVTFKKEPWKDEV